jgi:zinc protease
MHNLKLAAAEFDKEVRVVMEERRLRTDDQPDSLTYEKFIATAYTTHPYRNPVIGWMPDLERLKVGDLGEWYRRHYAPNNATLVVVGDVVPAEVVALAKKYFGDIPSYPLSPAPIPVEPPQTETRRVRVQAPAEVPTILIGFHVPAAQDGAAGREAWAMQVLAGILDGGDAARFARELIREQRIAARVDTGYDWNARYPTMLTFQGTPANGRSIEDLEKAILAQIGRLRTEPVSEEELARVKAQVAAQNVFQRDSTFYQALAIGQLAVAGLDWRMLDRYVDNINAVTAADVQAVARKYLVESNMTVAVLDPLPIDPKRPPRSGSGGGHVR